MVADTNAAIKWLRKNIHPNTKIVVWGHGVGAAVAAKMGADFISKGIRRRKMNMQTQESRASTFGSVK